MNRTEKEKQKEEEERKKTKNTFILKYKEAKN